MDYPEEKTERNQERKRMRSCADSGLICKLSEDLSARVNSKPLLKDNEISWAARRDR